MRKLTALLLALVLLISSAAFAESETWMEYDFGGFTMSFPIDIIGVIEEERIENQPFFYLFEDYDESSFNNKTLNCVWNDNIFDVTQFDPAEFGQLLNEQIPAALEASGVGVVSSELLAAGHDEHQGEPCLSLILASLLDYSAFGGPSEYILYTLQTIVSSEALGGCYTFTISTNDIENTQLLFEILDTVSWNA